jgi:hypothetical protein
VQEDQTSKQEKNIGHLGGHMRWLVSQRYIKKQQAGGDSEKIERTHRKLGGILQTQAVIGVYRTHAVIYSTREVKNLALLTT